MSIGRHFQDNQNSHVVTLKQKNFTVQMKDFPNTISCDVPIFYDQEDGELILTNFIQF